MEIIFVQYFVQKLIDKERKRHDKAIENYMQRAQIEWTIKGQERLDYINNEMIKEHKDVIRFTDLNAAMQQYFLMTGRQAFRTIAT